MRNSGEDRSYIFLCKSCGCWVRVTLAWAFEVTASDDDDGGGNDDGGTGGGVGTAGVLWLERSWHWRGVNDQWWGAVGTPTLAEVTLWRAAWTCLLAATSANTMTSCPPERGCILLYVLLGKKLSSGLPGTIPDRWVMLIKAYDEVLFCSNQTLESLSHKWGEKICFVFFVCEYSVIYLWRNTVNQELYDLTNCFTNASVWQPWGCHRYSVCVHVMLIKKNPFRCLMAVLIISVVNVFTQERQTSSCCGSGGRTGCWLWLI